VQSIHFQCQLVYNMDCAFAYHCTHMRCCCSWVMYWFKLQFPGLYTCQAWVTNHICCRQPKPLPSMGIRTVVACDNAAASTALNTHLVATVRVRTNNVNYATFPVPGSRGLLLECFSFKVTTDAHSEFRNVTWSQAVKTAQATSHKDSFEQAITLTPEYVCSMNLLYEA
jgi:hypothetical protein